MPKIRLRVTVFIALLALHAALLIIVATTRLVRDPRREEEVARVFLLLPGSNAEQRSQDANARRAPTLHRRARANETHTERERSASEEEEKPTVLIAIDWAKEAARAAALQIDADEERAHKASAFTLPKNLGDDLEPAAPARPAFHWGEQGVELIPAGAIFHLNDHCVIVVSILIVPACQVGEITPRGDLLEHMDDPKPLGAGENDLP